MMRKYVSRLLALVLVLSMVVMCVPIRARAEVNLTRPENITDEAIEKAVVAVDACVKDVIEAAKAQGYEAIIIADHGNADHALNEDGTPNTAHSLNPVPCVYVTENKAAKVEDGRLADVAPTILKIMGLEAPADMNGQILIK